MENGANMAKLNVQAIQDAFHNEMMGKRDKNGRIEFLDMFGVVAPALKKGLSGKGEQRKIVSFAKLATICAGKALKAENEKILADMKAADEQNRLSNLAKYAATPDDLEETFDNVADDAAVIDAYTNFINAINGKSFNDNDGAKDCIGEFECQIRLPEFDESDE